MSGKRRAFRIVVGSIRFASTWASALSRSAESAFRPTSNTGIDVLDIDMGGSLGSMVQTKVDRRRCGKAETALVERVRQKEYHRHMHGTLTGKDVQDHLLSVRREQIFRTSGIGPLQT